MTLAAADVWFLDILHRSGAVGGDIDLPAETQQTLLDARFKHQVGTGICAHDPGYRAFRAEIGCVGSAVRGAVNQAAFLNFTAAVKILIVERALHTGRGDHGETAVSLDARDVFARACVHTNDVALLNKEWYLYRKSRLGRYRFGGACGCVAFYSHLGLDDLKINRGR